MEPMDLYFAEVAEELLTTATAMDLLGAESPAVKLARLLVVAVDGPFAVAEAAKSWTADERRAFRRLAAHLYTGLAEL